MLGVFLGCGVPKAKTQNRRRRTKPFMA